ncbi:prolyl oligopeptidase family serine peptidase [Psychroflexus sp. YR1-1]|uniref:Prolyl oligopeptidase family serine peptidase n=1 Tax=Psychroflexus aurantiacus TaxID=2709310 RepID=A0A6B3QYZ7_9FLAO|nr:prolyl oligopeptidase family serine peptidase [Psychroflexus aurantiacus]NEV93426.1 prolyl oligopeptidase family serine peptidase [Psychroflexus aurantiacus]
MKNVLVLLLTFLPFLGFSQLDLKYQMPHEDILELADVPLPPSMSINPDASKALLIYRNQYKTIEDLAEDELRLAGLRINPKTNISSRTRFYTNLKLFDPQTKKESEIQNLPGNPKISNISWSPEYNYIAFTHTTQTGNELWVIDYSKKMASRLTPAIVNGNIGTTLAWLPDESGLMVKTLPENRPELINTDNKVPSGPTVSVNEAGVEAQNRTYQDLLKNNDDEFNFEVLATSEIHKVDLNGNLSLWKPAAMYSRMSISPDGTYVMVSEIHKPFSYIVTYGRFPTTYSIYTQAGDLAYLAADVPLMEEMPKGFMSTRTGPRDLSWRDDHPATLVWAEALDEGDANKEVEFRDEVFQLEAPFDEDATSLVKTQLRFSGILWGNEDTAVLYEYWWNTRTTKTSIFNPSEPYKEAVVFNERNYQDTYADPGNFVTTKNKYNASVLQILDHKLVLTGEGYSAEGKFPFVDHYNLKTQETERVFQVEESDMLVSFVNMIDAKRGELLTRRESSNDYPNYYIRNYKSGSLEQITDFENPFKALQNVHKEVITYEREDGLELSATLYLPVGYDMDKKEKMPMLMWAYPREYKDKASASQVTSSSKEFTYPYYGSPIYWVNRGYVVLDDAAFPIIGLGDEQPNDTFKTQLVSNAKAAIDAVDELGYIDRDKVAVGGHSYGAFMTANLLSHSDLFAAGIARSGAYNRTLTPFGFQSEERSYWEAPEVYNTMSPFMNAHKMKTPLLLIHGQADNNSGTYPMQSERYFNALKGLGAPARLVMLPKESHGYAAKESIMHMLWEQDEWLEKYVKNRELQE